MGLLSSNECPTTRHEAPTASYCSQLTTTNASYLLAVLAGVRRSDSTPDFRQSTQVAWVPWHPCMHRIFPFHRVASRLGGPSGDSDGVGAGIDGRQRAGGTRTHRPSTSTNTAPASNSLSGRCRSGLRQGAVVVLELSLREKPSCTPTTRGHQHTRRLPQPPPPRATAAPHEKSSPVEAIINFRPPPGSG